MKTSSLISNSLRQITAWKLSVFRENTDQKTPNTNFLHEVNIVHFNNRVIKLPRLSKNLIKLFGNTKKVSDKFKLKLADLLWWSPVLYFKIGKCSFSKNGLQTGTFSGIKAAVILKWEPNTFVGCNVTKNLGNFPETFPQFQIPIY